MNMKSNRNTPPEIRTVSMGDVNILITVSYDQIDVIQIAKKGNEFIRKDTIPLGNTNPSRSDLNEKFNYEISNR